MSSTRSAGAIGSVSRKRAQIERKLVSYSSANWVHWSPSSPSQAFAISTLAIGSLIRPFLGHGPNVRVRAPACRVNCTSTFGVDDGAPLYTEGRFSSSPHLRSPATRHRRLVGRRPGTEEVAVQILIVNFN